MQYFEANVAVLCLQIKIQDWIFENIVLDGEKKYMLVLKERIITDFKRCTVSY